MTLDKPLEIDLKTFVSTGKFDFIKLGQTKEWILNNFPDPDNTYRNNHDSPIWHYGNIEFHFNSENKLHLIYSDKIETLSGGQSIRLNKWIFNKPEELTIENIVRHLAKERLSYKLEYGTQSYGCMSAKIEIILSKVEFGFGLPEDNNENHIQYADRNKYTDSNLFRLFSIGLSDSGL